MTQFILNVIAEAKSKNFKFNLNIHNDVFHAGNKEVAAISKNDQKDFFFDFEGNLLNVKRSDFVNSIEDGKLEGVHIQAIPGVGISMIRVSSNRELVRVK